MRNQENISPPKGKNSPSSSTDSKLELLEISDKNVRKFGTGSWHNGYITGLPRSRPRFESQTQWLKLTPDTCACVPKIPKENGGEGVAA